MTIVVDASIAVKWFVSEVHDEATRNLIKPGRNLIAPDLICAEVGHAIAKRIRRKEMSFEEAAEILKDFQRFPLQLYESKVLMNAALDLADRSGASFYDSVYLALAVSQNSRLITADRKCYDLFKKSHGSKLIWVEEI